MPKVLKCSLLLLLLLLLQLLLPLQVSAAPPPRPKELVATAVDRLGAATLDRIVGAGVGGGSMRGNNRIVDTGGAATLKSGIKDTTGSGSVGDPDIIDLATVKELTQMEPGLSLLHKLMEDLGATFYLEQTRDLTMFMPTNKAFERSSVDVFTLPWAARWQIFQNLIIPQNVVQLSELSPGKHDYTSWQGSSVTLNVGPTRGLVSNRKITLNGGECKVLDKNGGIETFNGICYMIDCFVMPDNIGELLDIGGGKVVIENHVDNQETSTTIYAINGGSGSSSSSSSSSNSSSDCSDGACSSSADSNRSVDKGSKPIISASSSIVLDSNDFEAPEFVQHINIAHDQWNKSVKERKQNMLEIDRKHENSTTSNIDNSSSNSSNNSTRSSGYRSNVITFDEEDVTSFSAQEATPADDAVGLLALSGKTDSAESSNDDNDSISKSVIKALGTGDSEFSIFGKHDTYYDSSSSSSSSYSNYYEDPQSPISFSDYSSSSASSQLPVSSSYSAASFSVPAKYGWAGTSLGWNERQPGLVLPEPPNSLIISDSPKEITGDNTIIKRSSNHRSRNGWRRRNGRLPRLQNAISMVSIDEVSSSPSSPTSLPIETRDSSPLSSSSSTDSLRMSELGFDASVKGASLRDGVIPGADISGNDDADVFALGLEGGAVVVDLDDDDSEYSLDYDSDQQFEWETSVTERVKYSSSGSRNWKIDYDGSSSSIDDKGYAKGYEEEAFEDGMETVYWDDEEPIDDIGNSNYNNNNYEGGAHYSREQTVTDLTRISALAVPFNNDEIVYYPSAVIQPQNTSSITSSVNKILPSSVSDPPDAPLSVEIDNSYADMDVLSIVGEISELSDLHDMLTSISGNTSSSSIARRAYMTLFAPVNSAIELPNTLPFSSNGFNYKKILEEIGNNHITMGKRIDPLKLTSGKLVTADNKGRTNKIFLHKDAYGHIFINYSAKALKIYKAKNGFVYAVDQLLMPPYNEGPTLSEFIKQDDRLRLLRSIMGRDGLMEKYPHLGPITVFLATDQAYNNIEEDGSEEGIQVCVLDALNRPENAIYGLQLMGHIVLPGKVRVENMLDGSSWQPVYGEPLTIQKMYSEYDLMYKTFIDYKAQIIQSNIPIYNGYVHIIDSVLMPSSINIQQISYWSCLDSYLRKNRNQVRIALNRVDEYKSLPVLGTPPGPRPSWVGKGLKKYFLPPSTFYDYSKTGFRWGYRGGRGVSNGIGKKVGSGNRRGIGNRNEYSEAVYYTLA